MKSDKTSLSQIRGIDNSRKWLPFATTLLLVALITLFIWFFKGGSVKLYASAFFGFYFLTRQIWISVILIGLAQSIVFLPLRFIGQLLESPLKDFEEELEKTKSQKDQYILFNQNVKQGNPAVLFYIFSFFVHAIAFFSAGRLFLTDFYSQLLNPNLLYKFIPYPDYPLKNTVFKFPYFTVDQTTALPYKTIFIIWAVIVGLAILLRVLWRFFKLFLSKNKKILSARIGYNRLLLKIGGFSTTVFIASILILRHIPTHFSPATFSADLTRPNQPLNIITAVATFFTTIHAGFKRSQEAKKKARSAGLDSNIINRVFRSQMRESFRNAVVLGIGAYLLTNQIPSAFELSIATFEVIYILSPYTFDRLLKKSALAPAPTPVNDASSQPK